MKEVQTKEEAVAIVAAALRVSLPMISLEFQVAMDLSRQFDISAQDVLQYRKGLLEL